MQIQILDSWLREYVKTEAKATEIAEMLSLTSVSVDRVEKIDSDYLYDIEVTSNRPDLMSVIGLARETAAVLTQFGIKAQFSKPEFKKPSVKSSETTIDIQNDPKLVNRILGVVMDIEMKASPEHIKKRLESSGIRSLNNIIDVTNYVMREVGHPAHVFDYDRLATQKLIIRESKKGEKVVTLDKKVHELQGDDIVADNGEGEIVDLLGIMGTLNSVVTSSTKRILFFLDNNDKHRNRQTSMSLGIRSEAAVLNEKGLDPELAYDALLRGIALYEEIANGKIVSDIIDIYPNKVTTKDVRVTQEKINSVIGVQIPVKVSEEILQRLGFEVKITDKTITTTPPSFRAQDIQIPEDIVEEVARIYGYHRLPTVIPQTTNSLPYNKNEFYWESRAKNALKYWGFTESYTYSFVSEELYEGPTSEAVTLKNPLNEELVYMRRTLVPSLLQVVWENKTHEEIKIFELSNVYYKNSHDLPQEVRTLAGVIKQLGATFYDAKGVIEQLLNDLNIKGFSFKERDEGGEGADIYLGKEHLGDIEVYDKGLVDFELNFSLILKHVSLKKVYKPASKFPPAIEDLRLQLPEKVTYDNVVTLIKKQSNIVHSVHLLDVYKDKKTFRITYQHPEKSLTAGEITEVREKIVKALEEKLKVKVA